MPPQIPASIALSVYDRPFDNSVQTSRQLSSEKLDQMHMTPTYYTPAAQVGLEPCALKCELVIKRFRQLNM